ncbi:MAG: DUF2339 domain-containing protein [Alphaproteobacteria bacterium]|nr:DUF2339 domain-containing protein [Alphaproteobacteria bacterium]
MLFFLALVILFLFLAGTILPWVNRSRIRDLEEQIDYLREQVFALKQAYIELRTPSEEKVAEPAKRTEPPQEPLSPTAASFESQKRAASTTMPSAPPPADEGQGVCILAPHAPTPKPHTSAAQAAAFTHEEKTASTPKNPAKATKPKKLGFEQQFGTRLPVWIGGIALAFAGFYLVKYSIDMGLLSPTVRTVLSFLFGTSMLVGAEAIRNRPSIANGTRISQALSGAGIAVLYGTIFAASGLYELITPTWAFVGMAGVTALAVVLSLRNGMPIALLGLLGGFLTPAIINSGHPQAAPLFIYLYLLMAGLMTVIRRQNWWGLSLIATMLSFLWVGIWLFGGHFTTGDATCLGLFLLAMAGTVSLASRHAYTQETKEAPDQALPASLLNLLTLAGTCVMLGLVSTMSDFSPMTWGLLGLLGAGTMGLAFFDQPLYGKAPHVSASVILALLFLWHPHDPMLYGTVAASFAALFIAGGLVFLKRGPKPHLWGLLSAGAALSYYFVTYLRIGHSALFADDGHFWGGLALGLAALFLIALERTIGGLLPGFPSRENLKAIFSATCSAFISIALAQELTLHFLPIAFMVQAFALSLIARKIEVPALRWITAATAAVGGALLLPDLLIMLNATLTSLTGNVMSHLHRHSLPSSNTPILTYGLAALAAMGTGCVLRKDQAGKLALPFEASAVTLGLCALYFIARWPFNLTLSGNEPLFVKAGLFERATVTNAFYLYGMALAVAGHLFNRSFITKAGQWVFLLAVARTGYFDLLMYNPLHNSEAIGHLPLVNGLLILYGLPILWLYTATREKNDSKRRRIGQGGILLLAFTWLSLSVRHFYHGPVLSNGTVTTAEIYSYSAAWLLFGLLLLFYGTLKNSKFVRVASLGTMILTVGKVFLYDASELEGLLRVTSFLGLGLSLLGLSWFYSRFVFTAAKEEEEGSV